MDEVTHTILEQPNNMGFGGLGSGFVGGIIGGALFGNVKQKGWALMTGDDSSQNIVDICSALLAYKVLQTK